MPGNKKKEKGALEDLVGLFTIVFGVVLELIPLLALKTVPGSTVSTPSTTCPASGHCLTYGDWIIVGLFAIAVGLVFLAAGRRNLLVRRRGISGTWLTAALPVFLLAAFVLVFKPIPDCGEYINLLLFQTCLTPVNRVLGLDPDVFLAVMFAIFGTVILVFGSVRVGKGMASISARST